MRSPQFCSTLSSRRKSETRMQSLAGCSCLVATLQRQVLPRSTTPPQRRALPARETAAPPDAMVLLQMSKPKNLLYSPLLPVISLTLARQLHLQNLRQEILRSRGWRSGLVNTAPSAAKVSSQHKCQSAPTAAASEDWIPCSGIRGLSVCLYLFTHTHKL